MTDQLGSTVAARAFGVLCISLGAHMGVLGVLGFVPTPAAFFASQPTELEVIDPKPPAEVAPEPPKPPEPEPPKPVARPAAPKPAPPPLSAEPPKPAAPEPVAEAPVDFGGVTLTGDGSWSTVTGSGAALSGPVGRIAPVTGRDQQGVAAPAPPPPSVVDESALSRKPVAPAGMDEILERFFPERARTQGISGSAQLRVRIQADGRVGNIAVRRETGTNGFGDACMKALRMQRWQPPLDRRGNPVATDISFICEFDVGL